MRYEARAPLRIDLTGGWTDYPLFAEREGGAELSVAVTRYAHGYISRPSGTGLLAAMRGDKSYVHYEMELPIGAGLGGAAAENVLWTALVKTAIANVSDRREIAEIAWAIGNMLGILRGKQDEYAAALGGINFFNFGEVVDVEQLSLEPAFADTLRSHLILVNTGESRLSLAVRESVWQRYRNNNPTVVTALRELKALAVATRDAMLAADLEGLGRLIADTWAQQKALDPILTTEGIESTLEIGQRHAALGGKACGGGGGGCVILLAAAGRADELRNALIKRKMSPIEFDFDTYGVFLKKG